MSGLELVVTLGATILLGEVMARRSRVPAPVVLVVLGVALAAVPRLRSVEVPAELVLVVLLLGLLFWAALATSLREVRAALRAVLLTSTVLVVVTAAAVAATAHQLLGLAWGPAWVLGAAVAPTDATAVTTLAKALPRSVLTILRAESLVNDGTALVVYGIALTATLAGTELGVGYIAWRTAVAYGGGVAVGLLAHRVGAAARRRADDPVLGNLVVLLVPFASFLVAELIGASGVLAVVVAGLLTSRDAPTARGAQQRQQMSGFWSLSTYLVDAALFVLIGIEAVAAAVRLPGSTLAVAAAGSLAVYLVLVVVRFGFLVVTAYAIRLLDRRPSQRQRRVSHRVRAVSTLAGFRGAVTLAAALGVPAGARFPDRDVVVFVAASVVLLTLTVQGSLLPVAVRWAALDGDDGDRERHDAELAATASALDRLPALAAGAEPAAAEEVRAEYRTRLAMLRAHDPRTGSEEDRRHHDDADRLRRAMLREKRSAVQRLHEQRRIDDLVRLDLHDRIDLEELRLERRR